MLFEIVCDAFKQNRIEFHSGLNTILGTESGDNSIGKSSFLLVVDFVFGGDTYAKADDIIKNVGDHTIYFCYKFDEISYNFSRDVINYHEIWECDKNYNRVKSMKADEFCEWLDLHYKAQLPFLSFRNMVGRYIRVYGKDNANEKYPLHVTRGEKAIDACYALLKLFDFYLPIHSLASQASKSSDEISAYKKAQKYNFISKINKSTYSGNSEEIAKLGKELEELARNLEMGFTDIDAEVSDEAIRIKELLSRTRRMRSRVKSRYDAIDENEEYQFSITTDDLRGLLEYFPNANLQKLEDVENFHHKISKVFKAEISQEKRKLGKELMEFSNQVEEYERQLEALIKNPTLSRTVLQRHSDLLKQLEQLQKENSSYLVLSQLENTAKEDEARLLMAKEKQFAILARELNTRMQEINTFIYDEKYSAPVITFSNSSYVFFTPDDTGTGMAFKGLVVFDIAVLSMTKLPIIVHDSIVLKQISDIAIERILELYDKSKKQVIIALDKQDSYTDRANAILNDKAVLQLSPGGNELFGRSWG